MGVSGQIGRRSSIGRPTKTSPARYSTAAGQPTQLCAAELYRPGGAPQAPQAVMVFGRPQVAAVRPFTGCSPAYLGLLPYFLSLPFRFAALRLPSPLHNTHPLARLRWLHSHYSYSQRSLHCRIGRPASIGPPPFSCAPPAGHPQLRACTLRLSGSRSADTAPLYLPYSLRSRFLHRYAVQLLFVLMLS